MIRMLSLATVLLLTFGLSLAQKTNWSTVKCENSPTNRSENAFVKAGDKLYLLGGRGMKQLEIYDPATNTWSKGSTPPVEMHHFQAVSWQGLIYVMGGLTGKWPFELPLSHIYIYNPLEDHWTVGPEVPANRRRGAAGVTVYNDKIYIVCGIVNGHTSGWVSWLDEYDPSTNRWNKLPDAPRSRDHLQTAVVNNKLIVTGGRKSGFEGKGFEATIGETDVYDFTTGVWMTLPEGTGDIPTQRAGCTVAAHQDELIVIGGESGSQVKAHSDVEALNINTGQWRTMPPLVTGRHGTQVIKTGNTLYIAAGCGNRGGSPELNSLEKYLLTPKLPEGQDATETKISAGEMAVSETEINFNEVRPFSSKTVSITLKHTGGNQAIHIDYISITGNDAFTLELPSSLPFVLPVGGTVDIKVTCSPEKAGATKGMLFIRRSDHGSLKPLTTSLLAK